MPPQPGLFSMPPGASASHTQPGITTASSSALATIPPVGPGMGLALIGGSSKASRLGAGMGQYPFEREHDGGVMGKGGEMYSQIGQAHQQHSVHQHQSQQHSSTHPNLHSNSHRDSQHPTIQPTPGPSSRHAGASMEDTRKEKKRKESSKVGKETSDRRDEFVFSPSFVAVFLAFCSRSRFVPPIHHPRFLLLPYSGRHYTESINALHTATHILSTRPETYDLFRLRLYPLTIERSSLLAQLEFEERYSIECAQVAYDEERERVEEEWRRGRERVRERLLEGIEERRRRAREEKEGEGTIGDAVLDSHSRPPITRKLRNKLGTSPPPTPHAGGPNGSGSSHPLSLSTFSVNAGNANGTLLSSNLPITTGPFTNPHSLSVEDLPSPFPLPLTSSQLLHTSGGAAGAAGLGAGATGAPNGSRRRVKGGGAHQGQAVGGLGKSLLVLNTSKDNDLENDLGEIRRGNKRRRATAAASMAKTGAGL